MTNKRHRTFKGRFDQIRHVCAFVANGALEAGLDEDAVFQVELSCDEATTNIIEHAYGGDSDREIDVSYEYDDESFVVTLRDSGQPFDPHTIELPAEDASEMDSHAEALQRLKIGGLGLHFMRQMMDEIRFSFDSNDGNVLVMVKSIGGE